MSQPTDPGYPGDCPHASTPGWCPACVARLLAERDLLLLAALGVDDPAQVERGGVAGA